MARPVAPGHAIAFIPLATRCTYAGIGASPATTTRDLADLVEKGALLRKGERRHARYHLAIPLKQVSPVVLDEHGSFEQAGPFQLNPRV